MIDQHKSIEVVKIHWFCNSSLLLKKIRHKTTKIPVLRKLTHMYIYMGEVFSERVHKILKRLTPSNVLSSSVREWATSGGAEHPPLTHVGT